MSRAVQMTPFVTPLFVITYQHYNLVGFEVVYHQIVTNCLLNMAALDLMALHCFC